MTVLSSKCTVDNLVWQNHYANGYHFTNEDGEVRTVFDYCIPFPPQQEMDFCARYHVEAGDRMGIYQTWLQCIQREVSVSNHLAQANVNSILRFASVEQYQDENKVSHILLETEQVWPILDKLIVDSVPALTIIDIILRLSIILRDIGKELISVVHRGFDLNEVYINAQGKIVMGGFFYSQYPGGEPVDQISYFPSKPSNLLDSFQNGQAGSEAADIQMLCMAAWNLFSGLPHNAQISMDRLAKPEYAPNELVDTLLTGMRGLEESQCNLFRRNLLNCRKALNKTDYINTAIPIRKLATVKYKTDYI